LEGAGRERGAVEELQGGGVAMMAEVIITLIVSTTIITVTSLRMAANFGFKDRCVELVRWHKGDIQVMVRRCELAKDHEGPHYLKKHPYRRGDHWWNSKKEYSHHG
jgi:hypothetical protein